MHFQCQPLNLSNKCLPSSPLPGSSLQSFTFLIPFPFSLWKSLIHQKNDSERRREERREAVWPNSWLHSHMYNEKKRGDRGVNVLNHRTLVYVISTTLCHYPTLTQWWHHDLGKQSHLPCVVPCGDIVIRLHDSLTCSRAKYVLTSYVRMMKQDFLNTSHRRERRNHETL